MRWLTMGVGEGPRTMDSPVLPWVASWLLTYLLQSTVLVLAVAAVTAVGRFGPKTRDVLWRVALFGGLFTSSLTLAGEPAGVPPDVEAILSRVHADRSFEDGGIAPLEVESFEVWTSDSEKTHLPIRSGEAFGMMDSARHRGLRAGVWFWLVGAVVGLFGLGRDFRSLLRLRGRLEAPGPRASRAFQASVGAAPDHSVQLRVSSEVSAPCVLPGPYVVLPARCEAEMTDGELRAAVAHEVAHVRRRDVQWALLGRLVTHAFWVQPLNRLAWRGYREAAEGACDDWAVETTGDRYGLASSIERVVRWGAFSGPQPVVAIVEAGGSIVERVRRILHGESRRTNSPWFAAGLGLLLLAPLPLLPVLGAPVRQISVFVFEGVTDASVPVLGPGVERVRIVKWEGSEGSGSF